MNRLRRGIACLDNCRALAVPTPIKAPGMPPINALRAKR